MKQTIIQISVGIFFAGAVLSMPFSIITAQTDSFFQENLVPTDQAEDVEPEQAPLSLPESSISPEVIDHPINQEQSIAYSLIVQELELQIIQLQMQIAEFTEQLAVFLAENSIATAQVDFSFEKTLVPTDQAEDVSRLQEILESEGLYCLGCQVTGYFGYWTQAGLMNLQERYELSITGIVDEVTRVKLNELVGLAGSQGQPVPKEPDPSTETDVSTDSDESTSIEDLEESASASSPTPSPTRRVRSRRRTSSPARTS